MSVTTVEEKTAAPPGTGRFTHVMASEFVKLRTLMSARVLVIGTVLYGVVFGAVIAHAVAREYDSFSPDRKASFDPTLTSFGSVTLAQLLLAALGTVMVTSEYSSGMIRTSLVAVPGRARLLGAKTLTVALVCLGGGLVVGFGAFLSGQAALRADGLPSAAIGDPGVVRAAFGAALYLLAGGLIGLALGVLIRGTAAAVVVMIVVAVLIPNMTGPLPDGAADALTKYWPTSAGRQIMATSWDPDKALAPWAGFGVLSAFVAVLLLATFRDFRRRDP